MWHSVPVLCCQSPQLGGPEGATTGVLTQPLILCGKRERAREENPGMLGSRSLLEEHFPSRASHLSQLPLCFLVNGVIAEPIQSTSWPKLNFCYRPSGPHHFSQRMEKSRERHPKYYYFTFTNNWPSWRLYLSPHFRFIYLWALIEHNLHFLTDLPESRVTRCPCWPRRALV